MRAAVRGRDGLRLERSAGEGAEAARLGSLPRVDLSTGWSYSNIPSAVFAHKLDAGEFTAGDFAISRLNDPSGLGHLGSAVAVEAPIDAFGKIRTAAQARTHGGWRPCRVHGAKVTKAVAQHYLAELYLATNQPAKAEEKAQAVIGSGLHRLVTARYGTRVQKFPFTDPLNLQRLIGQERSESQASRR